MQTWLVHMRQPVRIAREIGIRKLVGFNLIGLGMIISAIAHPAFLATPFLVARDPLRLWQQGNLLVAAIVGVNLFNLVAGYLAVARLAGRTLALRSRQRHLSALMWLPLYWLLMAVACLRALAEIVLRPHHWDKTPHLGCGTGRRRSPLPRTQPRLAASRERA